MGIVRRQGLRNTVISYFGLGLGFVNTVLVLPRLLEPDQLGLTAVLVAVATIVAQVSSLGFGNMGVRFFPYFRQPESGHRGFFPFLLGVPLLGFAVVGSLVLIGKPLVLSLYDSPVSAGLLNEYYLWTLLLAFFTLLFSMQETYLRGLFHTSFPALVQEILLRLLVMGGAILFGSGYLSFHSYVLWFLLVNCGVSVLLTGYLLFIGELHLRPSRAVLRVLPPRQMLNYAGFALLGNVSAVIIQQIDTLMVSAKVDYDGAGIYNVAFFVSTALVLPFRALYRIAFPLLAEYWKSHDLPRMADFYRRTTRLNTALGCYLALGIGLNLDFIFSQMKPAYAAGTSAVLILLVGRLFDGITGLNGLIVLTSPRFRYDLLFNVSLAGLTIVLNLLLIPRFGLTGAAVATSTTLLLINVARTWFVWRSFRMQPFDRSVPLLLALAAVAGLAAWLVPAVGSVFLTMLVRSTVLTAVYGGLVLLTGALPEAQNVWQQVAGRLGRR